MSRAAGALLVALLLNACALLPEQAVPLQDAAQSALWQRHRAALGALEAWRIKGRIALANERQSGTLSLYWQQRGPAYELRLIAPLGQGTYLLEGAPGAVSLSGPKGLYLSAPTARQLMARGLGWDVDLAGLKYWARGLPAPGLAYRDLRLDQKGRLRGLRQAGLELRIDRYTEALGLSLPQKLSLRHDALRLKLVIHDWAIPR